MELLDVARKVRDNAYVPYSRFKVGAAVRGASGAVQVPPIGAVPPRRDGPLADMAPCIPVRAHACLCRIILATITTVARLRSHPKNSFLPSMI